MNLVYLPLSRTNCEYADLWFAEGRNYDILVNNWGDSDFFRDRNPELYFEIKEHKFRTLVKLYVNHFRLLGKYDYVMCPDPDLKIKVNDINRMFDIAKHYSLDLCQPSITGHLNHPPLAPVDNKNILIRHMNLIEPMCPIFSRKAMFSCLWTFYLSYSAWGLDFVWPIIVANDKTSNVGVINNISVEHTRPCVSQDTIFPNGKKAWDEHQETLAAFGLTNAIRTYYNTPLYSSKPKLML